MTQATETCRKRLMKEYRDLLKNPVENIRAVPLEGNILEWHYVIQGTKDSLYNGGYYHGIIRFPHQFPYKPPSLIMCTPNGRFKTHTRLCLSMSDFHPESWNPMWSVSTILMGLFSFMLEESPTLGSVSTTDSQKKKFAAESLENNCKDRVFCELFPDLLELHKQLKEMPSIKNSSLSLSPSSSTIKPTDTSPSLSLSFLLLSLAFISFLTWAAIAMAI